VTERATSENLFSYSWGSSLHAIPTLSGLPSEKAMGKIAIGALTRMSASLQSEPSTVREVGCPS